MAGANDDGGAGQLLGVAAVRLMLSEISTASEQLGKACTFISVHFARVSKIYANENKKLPKPRRPPFLAADKFELTGVAKLYALF